MKQKFPEWIKLSEEVAEALQEDRPVVALESSVWCQGLPRPFNLETAQEMESQVRLAGAIPALTWLEAGAVNIGATSEQLEQLCSAEEVVKVGSGDLAGALVKKNLGATTVSGTLVLADKVGIGVFATGGIGGVHRGWAKQLDVSADLMQLTRTRCTTVCSGAKSVLDISTTLEKLESLAVPLVLYRTETFPEFYNSGKESPLGIRCEEPEEIALAVNISLDLHNQAPLVAQCIPSEYSIPPQKLEAWVNEGLEKAETEGVEGKAVTPFLLTHIAEASEGQTLDANRVLLLHNAHLAGLLAVALKKS
ncbi:MAG: pseudouridine-5'-phosphate glycosidase [Vulcanimicrobiota bacterium]